MQANGAPDPQELQELTVPQLRDRLRSLGASTEGSKAELIARLCAPPAPAPPPPSDAEQHAFLDLAKSFRFDRVRQLVLENPAYVNAQPGKRWTALHQAAHSGDVATVEFLLEHGADARLAAADGRQPSDVAKDDLILSLLASALPPPAAAPAPPAAPPPSRAASSSHRPAAEPPAAKSQKLSGKSAASSGEAHTKKLLVKGQAAVDGSCPVAAETHVFDEAEGGVYDALLNQADIANNHNKYYIIQMLETDHSPHQYYTWNRWGRVGEERNRQTALRGPMSLAEARADFDKKFRDKTKNPWTAAVSGNFQTQPGKYTLLARDYGNDPPAPLAASSSARPAAESKLDKRVFDFVSMIADLKMMEASMREIGFDAKRLPLGSLKKEIIMKAYAALHELADHLGVADVKSASGASFPSAGKSSSGGGGASGGMGGGSEVVRLSNAFYTLIPHQVGRAKLPPISSAAMLKEKLELVEALGEIEVASRVLDSGKIRTDVHPVDARYAQLGATLVPVEKGGELHNLLAQYLTNTHGSTHSSYKLELVQAFEVQRQGEAESFRDIGNRQLLWHGSRLSNWCGILSQGLRIAPPEAPSTGYMFGKGLYFADCSSKSANYCFANQENPVGVLLLSEVALGEPYERCTAEFGAAESCRKAGKGHTLGVGKTAPEKSGTRELPTLPGVKVPMGVGVPTGVAYSSLLYNEFIVYDTRQVKQRYVLQVRFVYK